MKSGFAVYALDLRGRGKSDGERYFVERVEDYVDDLKGLIRIAKQREPGLPVFLLGHSAGGVTSCIYTLENQSELAGFICESFAFRVYAPDFALAVLKGLSHVAPHAHVLQAQVRGLLPRSRGRCRRCTTIRCSTTRCSRPRPWRRWCAPTSGSSATSTALELPLLILHGTADKATRPDGSQLFYDKAGSKDKTLKLYEGHYHDLLNDLDREKVMADITGWIDKHIPAA